jgi:putative RNA 2'-phosphotransferase
VIDVVGDPASSPALVRDSKFLSSVLRHNPGKIGVELDSAGWIEVEVLLAAMRRAGRRISRDRLNLVVEHNSKKRFEFDAAGTRIRASRGPRRTRSAWPGSRTRG